MEFNFRECIKKALIQAIGQKPDFEIVLAAAEWIKIGKMTEIDLAEIQTQIDKQYMVQEPEVEEPQVEEPTVLETTE